METNQQYPYRPTQPRFEYFAVVDTATQALRELHAERPDDYPLEDVDRKAHEFASMLIEVFNQADCQKEERKVLTR